MLILLGIERQTARVVKLDSPGMEPEPPVPEQEHVLNAPGGLTYLCPQILALRERDRALPQHYAAFRVLALDVTSVKCEGGFERLMRNVGNPGDTKARD
jgi:hypothetical protein